MMIGSEGRVQAGCKGRGIGTGEIGDVRGVQLDDDSDMAPHLDSGTQRVRNDHLHSVD